MELIDEEGRLFGAVNIIDALVILLVVSVAVAGGALLFGSDSAPEEPTLGTTNVTLDLGTQPTYIVAAIDEGDIHTANSDNELVVTDVHLTPQGGDTRVILRARLQGPVDGDSIQYAGAPPRLGRGLDISTAEYQVSGQIRDVGRNDSLTTDETRVVLRDTMTAVDAREVAPGDEIRLAGRTVATIQGVAIYPTTDPTQRTVFVEATLQTHRQQGERRFSGSPLRRGQTVPLTGTAYTLEGRVERIGSGFESAQSNVLVTQTVDRETANRIAAGDVAQVDGFKTAEVRRVREYATADPDQVRMFIGIQLETIRTGTRHQFGTTPVQRGNTVTIATDGYTLTAPIDRVGSLAQRGTATTRRVRLRMTDVRDQFADALQPGMTEQRGTTTTARLIAVDTEPSLIIATGDNGSVNVVDHPFNREVTLTAELRVRQTTTGLRFKGQPLRQGSEVVLDLGTVTVRATVVSVG